jgi:hypothetical protein
LDLTPFKGGIQAGGFVPVNFCSLILKKVYNAIANKQWANPKQQLKNNVIADHEGGKEMSQNVKQKTSLAVSLLSMCCLLGCATADFGWGNRFYSGRPLPSNEIALVFAVNDCSIYDIRDETEKEEKVFGDKLVGWGPWDMLDLPPGTFIAGVIYSRSTAGTRYELGGRGEVQINAQAGNIYILYPEFTKAKEKNTWRPILVNFNDYSKEDCQKMYGPLDSCYEKDKIRELATKYLQGERRIMSFHPFEKPIMNIWTRRLYNGVWR